MFTRLLVLACVLSLGRCVFAQSCDVAIYGGTPSGIAAAVAAARDGSRVTLIEPYRRLGGLLTNGLSHTDFRTLEGRTGIYLDFAKRVKNYYDQKYGADSAEAQTCFHGAFAEPKVNLQVFEQMLAEHANIRVLTKHRLLSVATTTDPQKTLKRIASITLVDENNSPSVLAPDCLSMRRTKAT